MRRNKTHVLNEVSAKLAGDALKSAIERIKRLSAEFAESDFKDTEILAKLQKLALQRNRFTDYINDANNEAADQVVGPLKRVIKKWSSGRTLSNGVIFKPLFTLKSDEVKTREVVKQRWGSDFETYKNDVKDIPFSKLIVIGLNSDFDALIKAGKKFNMDYSQYELLHDEYDAINDELKNDLLAINGISYSWSRADRRNKRNPYDTITMVFYIDTKLIDTEIMSQKLGGYSFYDTDYRKTAGACGGTKNGIDYSGVPYGTYKTRRMELHADEKLNNEKKDNKALYEKIMRNVSREVKKALNEMESALDYLPQPGVDYDPDEPEKTHEDDVYIRAIQYDLDSDYEDAEKLYNVIRKYEDMCNAEFLNNEPFKSDMYTSPFFAMLMLTIDINSWFHPYATSWFDEVWDDIQKERKRNKKLENTIRQIAAEVKGLNLNELLVFAIYQWWGMYTVEDIERYAETGDI